MGIGELGLPWKGIPMPGLALTRDGSRFAPRGCRSLRLSPPWKGIPMPIVRADEEVKISRRFIGEVYRDIVCRVGRTTGELSHLAPYWGEGQWMGA